MMHESTNTYNLQYLPDDFITFLEVGIFQKHNIISCAVLLTRLCNSLDGNVLLICHEAQHREDGKTGHKAGAAVQTAQHEAVPARRDHTEWKSWGWTWRLKQHWQSKDVLQRCIMQQCIHASHSRLPMRLSSYILTMLAKMEVQYVCQYDDTSSSRPKSRNFLERCRQNKAWLHVDFLKGAEDVMMMMSTRVYEVWCGSIYRSVQKSPFVSLYLLKLVQK